MTVNEIFERALALVDGITDAGASDTANTADYKARTPFLVNLFQMELIKSGDLFTKYPVAYKPLKNILLGGDHFEVGEHFTDDIIIESEGVAKVYYFECDGAGTVKIEDYNGSWNTLATVSPTNTGFGFVPYKALVTPSAGATKSRIVFSGSYYYRYRNVAMFAEMFSDISKVYDYGTRVKIALPSTAHAVKDVIFKNAKQYNVSVDYEVERTGNLWEILFDRNFEGEVLITYVPNPTKISTADLSESLTIDDFSANIMAYMLAEAFMNVEQNDYLAGLFKNKYMQLIAETQIKKPKPAIHIINKYGSV